jgi:hypothetical protein
VGKKERVSRREIWRGDDTKHQRRDWVEIGGDEEEEEEERRESGAGG